MKHLTRHGLFRRLLLLSFVLLMLVACVFVFAGCDLNGNPTENTTAEQTTTASEGTTTASLSSELVLFENKALNFRVIRPDSTDEEVTDAAVYICSEFEKLLGTRPQILTDYKLQAPEDANTVEILVGATNLEESTALGAGMCYTQCRIGISGNKIVIISPTSSSYSYVAEHFIDDIKGFFKNGRLALERTYSYDFTIDAELGKYATFDGGKISSYNVGYAGDKMLVYKSTKPEMFESYLKKAQSVGFSLYARHDMGKNLTATLVKDSSVAYIIYSPKDNNTRLILENTKTSALPGLASENVYTKTCTSSVTQMGLEKVYGLQDVAAYQIGMCYITRLADGSFIIVDGGFRRSQDASSLYKKLKELSPDGNIVIAAWIFSHHHGDHTGTFCEFATPFAKLVKIERFIFNFYTSDEAKSVNETVTASNLVLDAIRKFPDAKTTIAHPGQMFYIRNAEIEMLSTIDMLRPSALTGGNSACICFRIKIEGQTFLYPGDSYPDMTANNCNLFGDYLKSDFVQVIHHGAYGGSNMFYEFVDPTVVFWPLGAYDYYPWRRYEAYHTYLFTSTNIKQIILAASTDVTLPLPYTYPTEKTLPPEVVVDWVNKNQP